MRSYSSNVVLSYEFVNQMLQASTHILLDRMTNSVFYGIMAKYVDRRLNIGPYLWQWKTK